MSVRQDQQPQQHTDSEQGKSTSKKQHPNAGSSSGDVRPTLPPVPIYLWYLIVYYWSTVVYLQLNDKITMLTCSSLVFPMMSHTADLSCVSISLLYIY